jgi:hypothetical protein
VQLDHAIALLFRETLLRLRVEEVDLPLGKRSFKIVGTAEMPVGDGPFVELAWADATAARRNIRPTAIGLAAKGKATVTRPL